MRRQPWNDGFAGGQPSPQPSPSGERGQVRNCLSLWERPARVVRASGEGGSPTGPILAVMQMTEPRPTASTSAPPGPLAIETRGLRKRYGDMLAVQGVDLAIPAGEIFGLLGPNGAGKTTTIKILLGLTLPVAGRCWIRGVPVQP